MTGNPADGNTSEASLAEGETSLPPPAPAAAAAAAGTTTAAASSLLDAARRPRVEDSSCDDETDEKPVRQRRRPLDQENNNDDDDDDDSCYEGDNDNDNLLVMNRKDGCESEGTVGEEPTHHSDGSMEVGEARGVEDAVHHRQPQHTQQKQQRHHNRRGSLPSPSLLPSSPSRGGLASSEVRRLTEYLLYYSY